MSPAYHSATQFVSELLFFFKQITNSKRLKLISPPTENDRPTSLVPDLIDYNMPLTATYLKQMKLQCINNKEQVHLILRFLFLTHNSSACWSLSLTDPFSMLLCGCSRAVQVFLVLLHELVIRHLCVIRHLHQLFCILSVLKGISVPDCTAIQKHYWNLVTQQTSVSSFILFWEILGDIFEVRIIGKRIISCGKLIWYL